MLLLYILHMLAACELFKELSCICSAGATSLGRNCQGREEYSCDGSEVHDEIRRSLLYRIGRLDLQYNTLRASKKEQTSGYTEGLYMYMSSIVVGPVPHRS